MEQWKEIYPGYLVSTLGNVDSLKRGKRHRLKMQIAKCGYSRVFLYVNGVKTLFPIHRLVAQAFLPNIENKPEINHINGVKFDNRVENLEWCTHSENMLHAFATGLKKSAHGEKHRNAKLTNEQVVYIRNNPDGFNTMQLAEKFGVCDTTIGLIQCGKKYKTASGKIREKKPHPLKISLEQRIAIRRLYVYGSAEFGCTGLAKRFDLLPQTVWKIIHEND